MQQNLARNSKLHQIELERGKNQNIIRIWSHYSMTRSNTAFLDTYMIIWHVHGET